VDGSRAHVRDPPLVAQDLDVAVEPVELHVRHGLSLADRPDVPSSLCGQPGAGSGTAASTSSTGAWSDESTSMWA
jgi:hypothetical protein